MTQALQPATAGELAADDTAGFLRLESVDAARNRFRFYTFTWQRTLWGEWAICCSWGRIGSLGRGRVAYLGPRAGLSTALRALFERRTRRGYQPGAASSDGLVIVEPR